MNLTLTKFNFLKCPESDRTVFGWLFCLAILTSLILIAIPSFYSHDELEKVDHILKHGFADYLAKYLMLESGNSFVAVRPVSYLVEGLVSLFLPAYPFMVHLVDVLMHGTVAALLFVIVRNLHGSRQLAWVASLIFLINPLVTFSVGWSGALMDRLYILFGLAAFVAAHRYIAQQGGKAVLVGVFVASTLAILSKETGVILPGMLLVYLFVSIEQVDRKRIWTAFAAWVAPIVLFLLYRMPALINTFSIKTPSPYSGSITNVPEGIFIYFIYPFLPFLTEAHNWALQSTVAIGVAVLAHLLLLGMLWRAFSYKAVLAYLVGYFLFLFPVLFIPIKGSHYLYGSGLTFSVAVGALLTFKQGQPGHKIFTAVAAGLLALSVLHTLVDQLYFYRTGTCMKNIESSIESTYLADRKPEKMAILIKPDSPGYVLHRYTTSKSNIGPYFPVEFQVVEWDKRKEISSDYIFNCDCLVYRPPAAELKAGNWGPQSTVASVVPNQQPDGNAGIFIEVSPTEDLGELEVLFAGEPAKFTVIQPKLITAAITPDKFAKAGEYEVAVRQVDTGKIFSVGVFRIEPAN